MRNDVMGFFNTVVRNLVIQAILEQTGKQQHHANIMKPFQDQIT